MYTYTVLNFIKFYHIIITSRYQRFPFMLFVV